MSTDGPIKRELKGPMNIIANAIDGFLNSDANNKKYGFAILTMEFGDPEGTVNYISNATRKDVIDMMKAFIKRNEEKQ